MKKNKIQIILLVSAIIMMVVSILNINFDQLTNLKVNLRHYLGFLAMFFLVLSMYISIKKSKKKEG